MERGRATRVLVAVSTRLLLVTMTFILIVVLSLVAMVSARPRLERADVGIVAHSTGDTLATVTAERLTMAGRVATQTVLELVAAN